MPQIRFIIHTVSSARDRNGNCYHFSRVTSTITGRSMVMHSDEVKNVPSRVMKCMKLSWDDIYYRDQQTDERILFEELG